MCRNQEEEGESDFPAGLELHAKYMQSSFRINMQMRLANRRSLTNGWKLSAWPGGGEVGGGGPLKVKRAGERPSLSSLEECLE